MVLNVAANLQHNGSVNLTWDRAINVAFEIKGYVIYYDQQRNVSNQTGDMDGNSTEQIQNVSNSVNSLLIENLTVGAQYQFQVVVIAEIGGDIIIGKRSMLSNASTVTVVTLPMLTSTSTTQKATQGMGKISLLITQPSIMFNRC